MSDAVDRARELAICTNPGEMLVGIPPVHKDEPCGECLGCALAALVTENETLAAEILTLTTGTGLGILRDEAAHYRTEAFRQAALVARLTTSLKAMTKEAGPLYVALPYANVGPNSRSARSIYEMGKALLTEIGETQP